MKLTGKCKEDFEKWIKKQKLSVIHDVGERQMNVVPLGDMFVQLHESMQYGVYEDFFDSVNLFIEVIVVDVNDFSFQIFKKESAKVLSVGSVFNIRSEARTAAIEKANEIYNKTFKTI
tara:strand:+ start:73 stop:426 length:354 start_codon:yes stop_codon:yes gene_type:complete